MSISVIHLFFSKKKKICWTIVLELEWMKHVSLAAVLHYIIWVFNVFYWWHYFIWSINHITCWLWAYCRLFEKEQSLSAWKKKILLSKIHIPTIYLSLTMIARKHWQSDNRTTMGRSKKHVQCSDPPCTPDFTRKLKTRSNGFSSFENKSDSLIDVFRNKKKLE